MLIIKKSIRLKVNEDIIAEKVRLIDVDGKQLGILEIGDALKIAKEKKADLVEIFSNSVPSVCKLMDADKYIYDLNKKKSSKKRKQKITHLKRLRLRPSIDKGDYAVKLKNMIKFIKNGDKVEVSIRFKGREMAYKDFGIELLNKIRNDLIDYADVESEPKFDEKQLVMILMQKK